MCKELSRQISRLMGGISLASCIAVILFLLVSSYALHCLLKLSSLLLTLYNWPLLPLLIADVSLEY